MKSVDIRPIGREDRTRHAELLAHAFGRGRQEPAPPEADEGQAEAHYGLFNEAGLQAAYTLAPFRVHWGGGATLGMGGIAGVGTFVEARGRGHVAALLRHSLEVMRARGQVVSALYPFSWAFYRRSGWDWVGQKRHVTLPLREVRASPEGKNVRAVTAEESRPILTPIYARFAERYRGMCDVGTHQWDGLLKHHDSRTTYVYVHQSPGSTAPDGYLVWRFPREGGTGRVREFIATSPDAYRGLLSLLHYFGAQTEKAALTLPDDDPLWLHLMHWDVETRVGPVWQARVVDAPAALRSLRAPEGAPDGGVTVALRDEDAPWNAGAWRVAVEDGAVDCAPSTDEPAITFDITSFSQAFWGVPSVSSLVRAGRVEAKDSDAVAFLERLFAGPSVFTLDDF